MSTLWPRLLLVFVLLVTGRGGLAADTSHDLASLERSFWLHASLAPTTQKGYWGPAYPASKSPTESDIRNAAKLLTSTYAVPFQEIGAVYSGLRDGRLSVEE